MSAPDWIICRIHSRDEAVLALSALTGEDTFITVGRAIEWFRWIDQHLKGPDTNLKKRGVNLIVGTGSQTRLRDGCIDFASAMADEDVGWITVDEEGRVQVVMYEKNFGQSAKRRHLDARRKKDGRRADNAAAKCPHDVCEDADETRTGDGQTGELQDKTRQDKTPTRPDTDPTRHRQELNTGAGAGSCTEAEAGPDPPAPPATPAPPDGLGDNGSAERFRNLFVIRLCEAFRHTAAQGLAQRKSFRSVARRFINHPSRDDIAQTLIDLAREKKGAGLDCPEAAWQKEVNARYPAEAMG